MIQLIIMILTDKTLSKSMKGYYAAIMFFPIIGLIVGGIAYLSFFTPSYYYRYRWNFFYPIFIIIDLVY